MDWACLYSSIPWLSEGARGSTVACNWQRVYGGRESVLFGTTTAGSSLQWSRAFIVYDIWKVNILQKLEELVLQTQTFAEVSAFQQ